MTVNKNDLLFFCVVINAMPQGILIASTILIIFVLLYLYFGQQQKQETFRITTAPRPKTFDDLMTGVPLDEAYNNEIFEEKNCSGAPGMEYLL